jgi:putative phage-type endonuclease
VDRAKWLEERRKSIGGSDAAAIIGLNPYVTPYMVWADKTGRLPEREDNEAMRQGRDLEDYVASRWMEKTGKKCRRRAKMLYNSAYSFAHANIDRWVTGENAGLECKTTSVMNLKKFKNGEYPESYYAQCVHYMAVTGADRWYLGVLVLNQGFYEFVIERDQAEIDALMSAEGEFWVYVENDTPPPIDGLKPTTDTLNAIYANGGGDAVELFGRESMARTYLDISEQIKTLRREQAKIAQTLKADLQNAETGICGAYTVQWKKSVRASVSKKLLRKRYPKINLNKIMKATTCRRFSIKEDV